jgi:DNA-binding NtrC family response regulator
MADNSRRDWKELAQLAAVEPDPDKLLELINELNAVLLERERQVRGKTYSKRLLLVDDDPNIRLTLLPVLQEHGFEVQLTSTVADALEAIANRKFDLLVSDLNISAEGDGFHVVTAMRKAHSRCVIVLLTGYPAFESAVKGIHEQVDAYIVKPADYDALIETLEKKLAAKRGL